MRWHGRRERVAEAVRKGEVIRRLHWQCWRDAPAGDAPPVEVSQAELVEVLPVLLSSGSVGLVWPRVMHREAELGAVGAAMRAGYEAQVAHNAGVSREIGAVVSRLREHAVEPVLIKGLAVARLYPSPLVRPAGDIDLVVRDRDYAAAKAALADWRGHVSFHQDPAARREARQPAARGDRDRGDDEHRPYGDVDLHRASLWYGSRGNARFFADAVAVEIAGERVHVPRVEDHLRALCLHFLRHGAVRPMRLCDIALLVERYGAGMDWARVLTGSRSQVEQIGVALRLAATLLGARISRALEEARTPPLYSALSAQLPAWLVPAVLTQWGENPRRTKPHLRVLLGGPGAARTALASRWPDPLMATVRIGARFDDGARWPVQLVAYAKHAGLYAIRAMPRGASRTRVP